MRAAFKVCASVIGIVLATATASLGSEHPSTFTSDSKIAGTAGIDAPSPMSCCKVCTKGKACGNSCIAADKNCHQPPGCACDG
jgi:hypothetical protein